MSLRWIGKEPLVGQHWEVSYHLLRADPALSLDENGIDGVNDAFTGDVLDDLPGHEGAYVVFREDCQLGTALLLKRAGVTFRQIPYPIKVS